MYVYKAKIVDVHDGDTVTAIVDLGFHTQIEIKVRLFGINAPELKGETKNEGLKSKNRVIDLILNKVVTLKTHKDKQEKYGRWLAEIYLPNQTKSINNLLVEEKLAIPFMVE